MKKIFLLSCVLCVCFSLAAQIDLDEAKALQEFQWGIRAYHEGLFNNAIVSFERALSIKPDLIQVQKWLGWAYFRSGFDEAAMDIWTSVLEFTDDAVLQNHLEIIQNRRAMTLNLYSRERYVVSDTIYGQGDDYSLFRRPSSITALNDGGFVVTSFASNELVVFNANGQFKRRLRGGLQGLNHPFDVLELNDGSFLVSEYRGDRIVHIDKNDRVLGRFGGKGLGEGELLGPQYLSSEHDGYFYVSDFGNRRIVKYNLEGEYILDFGRESIGTFPGFKAPTGVMAYGQHVFVADAYYNALFVFDSSGNYLRYYTSEDFVQLEGLSLYSEGYLLLADTVQAFVFDIEGENFIKITEFGSENRVTKLIADVNGHLMATDFDRNLVPVMSELTSMYSGYQVRIEKINAHDFPVVQVEVRVEDRFGRPIVGLEGNNFIVTENYQAIGDIQLQYIENNFSNINASFILDRSMNMQGREAELRDAVSQYFQAANPQDQIRLIAAGESPSIVSPLNGSRAEHIQAAALDHGYTNNWNLEQALRLAGSELVRSFGKRAVVFFGGGTLPDSAFEQYQLIELVQFFRNNDIPFYYVLLDQNIANLAEEFRYLCESTGGAYYSLYQAKGIIDLPNEILNKRIGRYVLQYRSLRFPDFGRAYMPVEVEAFLFNKSGRDESAYFAPQTF